MWAMKTVPKTIGGARVVCFTPIDQRHRHTGNCKQIVGGAVQGPAAGLAICQYARDDAYYLFGCDADWNTVTDTWHQTLDEAKQQAEFEYEGVSDTWQDPPYPPVEVELRRIIDLPWTDIAPIRIGDVPTQLSTPDAYVTIAQNGTPRSRINVYRARADELFAFSEARQWGSYVVIGFGHRAFIVEPENGRTLTIQLGSYFGDFYPSESCLLIASAERLFCVDSDGSLKWESVELGIDGVVVEKVIDGVIDGQGEWDPPGGWRSFRIELASGKPAPQAI